jgi:trimeric autotransporter adhesin
MQRLFLLLACCILNSAVQAQIITTIAGNGAAGFSGDNISATGTSIDHPSFLTVDATGNVYIADFNNNRIRKINASGIITTIAGTGIAAFSGDNGPATNAEINHPGGIILDAADNIYFSDNFNHRIRKINTSGTITTIAGTGTAGSVGNGTEATNAQFNSPHGLTIDAIGNFYIADYNNNLVRKINSAGTITTIAGTGISGYSGDGGIATSAALNRPYGIVVDAFGNIFFSEYGNNCIRKISTSGIISTVAGVPATGTGSYNGDNISATTAKLSEPCGITLDGNGNLYIADGNNSRVRKVSPATNGVITTITGNGSNAYNGDGGLATLAGVSPLDIAVDVEGSLYITDFGNNRIRYIRNTVSVPTINASKPELHVYPNPSHGAFTVQWSSPESAAAQVIITSLLGEKVKELTIGANKDVEIQLNAVPGVYFINCMADGVRESVKVVISP